MPPANRKRFATRAAALTALVALLSLAAALSTSHEVLPFRSWQRTMERLRPTGPATGDTPPTPIRRSLHRNKIG